MKKSIIALLLLANCFSGIFNCIAQDKYKKISEVRLKRGVNGDGFSAFDAPEGEVIIIGNFVDFVKVNSNKNAEIPPNEKYLATAWKISKKGKIVWEKAYSGYTFIKKENFNPLSLEPRNCEIYLYDLTKKSGGEKPSFPVFKLSLSGEVMPDQVGWFDGYEFELLNADNVDIYVCATNEYDFGYGPDSYSIRKNIKEEKIWTIPLGDSISSKPELIPLKDGGSIVAFSAGIRDTTEEEDEFPGIGYTGYKDPEFSKLTHYLLRLDASGNKLWQKIIGIGKGEIEGIKLAPNNIFYLEGSTEKLIKVPCDSARREEGVPDCFDSNTIYWVKKIDFDGNILWQQENKPREELWWTLDDGGALFSEFVPEIGKDSLSKTLAFTLLNGKAQKQWTYRWGQDKVCSFIKLYPNNDFLFHSYTVVADPLDRPYKTASINNSLVRVNNKGQAKSLYKTGNDFLDLKNIFCSQTGDFIIIGEPQLVKNQKGVLEESGYVLCQRINKKKYCFTSKFDKR